MGFEQRTEVSVLNRALLGSPLPHLCSALVVCLLGCHPQSRPLAWLSRDLLSGDSCYLGDGAMPLAFPSLCDMFPCKD